MITTEENHIIQSALAILERENKTNFFEATSPRLVQDFLRLLLANEERELFCVLFLNIQNYIVAHEILFYGTLASTSVHPREVVKSCLKHNCAAVVIAHNHPSGSSIASQADIKITLTLRDALALVDVNVLDHFVVTRAKAVSMAEQGLI